MCICSSFKNRTSPSNVFDTFFFPSSFFLKSLWNPALKTALHVTICSLFVLVGVLLLSARGWAWEVNTHAELTEEAIKINEGDLNAYLITNLGLENGLNESLPGGNPRELMIQGSNTEDDGRRPLNHFHEPILNRGSEIFGGISAIDWSLSPLGTQSPGGKFSWNDAREYYFKALTSETKAERDENWGKTFRALGQVMHLLQDSANPSHVRDDLHAFDDGLHDFMERRSVGSYIGSGIFSPDPSMLEQPGPAGPNGEPFANLFDRDTYHGSAPEATLGADIGVTEYTNANFFSDDTIPGQGSIFSTEITHPTVAELVPAPVPSPYLTLPRLGSAAFPGARAAKLTGNQAVATFLLTNTSLDLLGQLHLDDAVYEGQSINLIPRAVGYSAAVLDYFFRGDALGSLQFEVESSFVEFGPGGENLCDETPIAEFGYLISEEGLEIPSSLGFLGTSTDYYDRSPNGDGERVPFSEGSSGLILLSEIPSKAPVRWTVVFDGSMGPGTKEARAVFGKTGLADWKYICDD